MGRDVDHFGCVGTKGVLIQGKLLEDDIPGGAKDGSNGMRRGCGAEKRPGIPRNALDSRDFALGWSWGSCGSAGSVFHSGAPFGDWLSSPSGNKEH